MVQLMELQRKADASKAVYEAFLNRTKQVSAEEGIQQPDARVSSPAQAPLEPTSPNIKLNLALGFVLAVLGGLAVVLLLENLDGGLRTSSDIESKLQMPSLGAIPQLMRTTEAQRRHYVVEKPFSSFAESFRSLKTSLMFSRTDREIRLVAVSSALPGEGKTLTTLSFGRSIAQSGTKVLIIDADLRRRMLTAATDITVPVGLVEVLEGKATLESAIVKDELSGAYMLLLSDTPAPTADLLSGPALAALFERLKLDYEMIIIDTAPVLAVAETRAVAALADATLFLVRWSKTPKQAASAALDLLINAGGFVAGVCLTQVNLAQQARLGYGDKLYYYQAYRKYYTE
jgi:capsular exopolysaccharide synthesis family protein